MIKSIEIYKNKNFLKAQFYFYLILFFGCFGRILYLIFEIINHIQKINSNNKIDIILSKRITYEMFWRQTGAGALRQVPR